VEPGHHPQRGEEDLALRVDGVDVRVRDRGVSLLDLLRDDLHIRSVKDGCSPQGQCGCCTVLVDGTPRVACVTPARRMAGRDITTLDGLAPDIRAAWADALVATGGSQCGFCTPGIVVRLEALRRRAPREAESESVSAETLRDEAAAALRVHLCRCTGWRTILDAHVAMHGGPTAVADTSRSRDLEAAGRRASIEGSCHQQVGPGIVTGHGGFAADTAPADALVAVPDGRGGWVVGESLAEAVQRAGKVQGRRTTVAAEPPLALPHGDWHLTLRTSWVEPAYLEPDASWCEPGGEPSSPTANGGDFGGKSASPAPAAARALADRHGRAVLAVLSRDDAVQLGHKRPPIAAGVRSDGTGVMRVARTDGLAERIRAVVPGLEVVEVPLAGPPTSSQVRGAGWAEAVVLAHAATNGSARLTAPGGGSAEASIAADGRVHVRVWAGEPLDEVVLRSYVTGAAHMALGWVTSEAIAVDDAGQVHDRTIRSFGVLRAVDTPVIEVEIERGAAEVARPAVNASDAAFAAVALAMWRHQGLPPEWPTGVPVRA
jgi:xanthine dehydrogenase small subunit